MLWYQIIIIILILLISGYFAFNKYFKKGPVSCDGCAQSSCDSCDLVEIKKKIDEAKKKGDFK